MTVAVIDKERLDKIYKRLNESERYGFMLGFMPFGKMDVLQASECLYIVGLAKKEFSQKYVNSGYALPGKVIPEGDTEFEQLLVDVEKYCKEKNFSDEAIRTQLQRLKDAYAKDKSVLPAMQSEFKSL